MSPLRYASSPRDVLLRRLRSGDGHVERASRRGPNVQFASPQEKGKPRPVINASQCIGCASCVDVCPEAGTLAMAGGKAILQNPDLCTGHAQCITVCPTSAITLAFGNVLQTIRVPNINQDFETNVPGLFIVGELGGMGLIKTAISEGKLVIDRLRQRFEASGQWSPARDDHGASQPPAGRPSGTIRRPDRRRGPGRSERFARRAPVRTALSDSGAKRGRLHHPELSPPQISNGRAD